MEKDRGDLYIFLIKKISDSDGLPRPLQLRPLQPDPGQGGGGGGGERQPHPGQPGGAALHKD